MTNLGYTPPSVLPLLQEMAAVASRLDWFSQYRLSVFCKPGIPVDAMHVEGQANVAATFDELEVQKAKADAALASLARHFERVVSNCPRDMSAYFDWLVDESHDAIHESQLGNQESLLTSCGRLIGIAKHLLRLSNDPPIALKNPPHAFRQRNNNPMQRLARLIDAGKEWPQQIPYDYSFSATHRSGLRYSSPSSHWEFTKRIEEAPAEEHPELADAENAECALADQNVVQQHWDPAKEARDEWLYASLSRGVIYKAVKSELSKLCKINGWEFIGSASGMKRAANQYATLKGLPALPTRKHGRPKGRI